MPDLEKIVPAWPKKSHLQRLLDCRLYLLVHGFLTDAEAEKVKRRITLEVMKCNAAKRER